MQQIRSLVGMLCAVIILLALVSLVVFNVYGAVEAIGTNAVDAKDKLNGAIVTSLFCIPFIYAAIGLMKHIQYEASIRRKENE